MYDNEYDDEEEQKSGNIFINFYNNNKLLVWIFCGIILFVIIMSLLTKSGGNGSKIIDYKVEISPKEDITISIGNSFNLVATIEDVPNAEFTWTVEDENVAKVDDRGNVVGIDYGKTKVTATYIDNNDEKHSASKDVTIAVGDPNVKITDVSFKDGDLFMPLDANYIISLMIVPSNGYIENKEFISSNTNVVTVDNNGNVNAVGEGEATISFDVNNGEFQKDLNVYVSRDYNKTEILVVPDEISFDGELRKIKVGASERLTYTVTPTNADKSKLTWESSDTDVVTVDDSGRIKGIKKGNAVVTLSSVNGKKDRIDVEVENDIVPVTDINLSISDISLKVGQSQTITPIVSPDNASNKALNFMSLDNSIAVASPNETGTQVTIVGVSIGSTSIVMRSSNNIEKRLIVNVTSSSSDTPSDGGSSDTPSDDGSTISQGFKISSKDANNKGYVNDTYEKTKPRNNGATGPVTITVTKTDSSVNYLKVITCVYPASSSCNESASGIIRISGSDSFVINNSGEYVIRVYEYDSNNNLKRTTDKYIWIKSSGGGTVSGSIVSFGGNIYDSQTMAKANSYHNSGTISININSSNGYAKVCYSNSTTNCDPNRSTSLTLKSNTTRTLGVGLWTFNTIEVYNDGTTKRIGPKYVYIDSSGGSNPPSSPTPTSTAPSSADVGAPVISNAYPINAHTEVGKDNPKNYPHVAWNSVYGYIVGLRIEYDTLKYSGINRVAWAGSYDQSTLKNLKIGDYATSGCYVGRRGANTPKIQPADWTSGTKCIWKITEIATKTFNYSFDVEELDVIVRDNKGRRTYYISVALVDSNNRMSNPAIFRIETDGTKEQANWTVTRVQ